MKPEKLFTILIDNVVYYVYDIDGKEHLGENGEPKTWWIYFAKDVENPSCDSKNFIPYHYSAERLSWDIKISQSNTSKYKWNSTHFSSRTTVEMWCNNKLVYEFITYGGSKGLDFALAKVKVLEVTLCEHSYNFLNPMEEEGRKICWYGLPATIKVQDKTWEIAIIPDYTAGLNKEQWWEELKKRQCKYTAPDMDDDMKNVYFEESKASDYINWGDALSDSHIYWFRK